MKNSGFSPDSFSIDSVLTQIKLLAQHFSLHVYVWYVLCEQGPSLSRCSALPSLTLNCPNSYFQFLLSRIELGLGQCLSGV